MKMCPPEPGRGPAILLAGAIALATTLAVSAGARAERVCHNKWFQGSSPLGVLPYTTQKAALDAAKQNWIFAVTSAMHPEWGDLLKSKDRKQSCNRVPNGIGGYNHTCVYRAVPCRDEIS